METVRRYDVGRLGKAERTPQGGVRIPAYLTRTGVLEYQQPDGTIRRELRSPDEVAAPAAMQSLVDAPITDFHPCENVNGANYRELAVGHITGAPAPTMDGQFVAAVMIVQDANECALIDAGDRVENSCGYDCWLDMTPGVDPVSGQAYDAVQRNIVYNHVALLPRGYGRAGTEVALRLDSKGAPVIRLDSTGNALPPGSVGKDSSMSVPVKRKDGDQAPSNETPPAETPPAKADAGTCATCCAPVGEDGKYVQPTNDAPPAPEKPAPKVEQKTDARELVRERVGLERVAIKAGIAEDRLDSMTDDEVRRAVVSKAFPDHKTDGMSGPELGALYALAKGRVGTQPLATVLGGRSDAGQPRTDSGLGLIHGFAISQDEAARKKGTR